MLGLHLEGPFMAPQKKGAHDVTAIHAPERGMPSVAECQQAKQTLLASPPAALSTSLFADHPHIGGGGHQLHPSEYGIEEIISVSIELVPSSPLLPLTSSSSGLSDAAIIAIVVPSAVLPQSYTIGLYIVLHLMPCTSS